MSRIDLDAGSIADFQGRILSLEPNAERRWGTMTAAQMLAHLRIIFEISLEEREVVDESRRWLLPILWLIVFEWWTNWPKGRIKASPQFLDPTASDFDGERDQVLSAMVRFVAHAERYPERKVLEPMLGRVSLRKWRRIHGVHTDYHLRQFGV